MTGGAPTSESDPRGNDDAPLQGRGGGPGPYHPNNRGPDRGGGGYRRSPSPLHSGDRRRSSPSPAYPGRRSRGGRSRSVTPPPGGGGGSGRRPRRSSRSWSRSRSRSPRGGRYHRDHHHMRDHHHRDPYREYNNDRQPPYRDSGPYYRDDVGGRGDYNRGPPPDFPGRRGGDRRDLAGPSPYHRSGPPDNGHSDSGPRGGGGGGDRRGGRGGGGPEGPPGVSLLVRNIAPDITTADLQNAFGRIGVIRDVYVPRDYHSQQPRGFAFIEYATPEMARDAKNEMNRFVIKGHEIEVVFAQERRKTPGEMRGRSADAPDDDRAAPPSRSGDRGGGGGGGRGGGGSGFERSSSFERHKQRERDDPGRKDRDSRPSGNRDDDGDAPRP